MDGWFGRSLNEVHTQNWRDNLKLKTLIAFFQIINWHVHCTYILHTQKETHAQRIKTINKNKCWMLSLVDLRCLLLLSDFNVVRISMLASMSYALRFVFYSQTKLDCINLIQIKTITWQLNEEWVCCFFWVYFKANYLFSFELFFFYFFSILWRYNAGAHICFEELFSHNPVYRHVTRLPRKGINVFNLIECKYINFPNCLLAESIWFPSIIFLKFRWKNCVCLPKYSLSQNFFLYSKFEVRRCVTVKKSSI